MDSTSGEGSRGSAPRVPHLSNLPHLSKMPRLNGGLRITEESGTIRFVKSHFHAVKQREARNRTALLKQAKTSKRRAALLQKRVSLGRRRFKMADYEFGQGG